MHLRRCLPIWPFVGSFPVKLLHISLVPLRALCFAYPCFCNLMPPTSYKNTNWDYTIMCFLRSAVTSCSLGPSTPCLLFFVLHRDSGFLSQVSHQFKTTVPCGIFIGFIFGRETDKGQGFRPERWLVFPEFGVSLISSCRLGLCNWHCDRHRIRPLS